MNTSEKKMQIVHFVRSLISIEGNLIMDLITERPESYELHCCYRNEQDEPVHRIYELSQNDVEEMIKLNTLDELLNYYHQIGYFKEV